MTKLIRKAVLFSLKISRVSKVLKNYTITLSAEETQWTGQSATICSSFLFLFIIILKYGFRPFRPLRMAISFFRLLGTDKALFFHLRVKHKLKTNRA